MHVNSVRTASRERSKNQLKHRSKSSKLKDPSKTKELQRDLQEASRTRWISAGSKKRDSGIGGAIRLSAMRHRVRSLVVAAPPKRYRKAFSQEFLSGNSGLFVDQEGGKSRSMPLLFYGLFYEVYRVVKKRQHPCFSSHYSFHITAGISKISDNRHATGPVA